MPVLLLAQGIYSHNSSLPFFIFFYLKGPEPKRDGAFIPISPKYTAEMVNIFLFRYFTGLLQVGFFSWSFREEKEFIHRSKKCPCFICLQGEMELPTCLTCRVVFAMREGQIPSHFGRGVSGKQGQGWGSPHECCVATSPGRQPPQGHSPATALVRGAMPTFCDNFIQLLSSWVPGTQIK